MCCCSRTCVLKRVERARPRGAIKRFWSAKDAKSANKGIKDALIKSVFVIPAKAGIANSNIDPGFLWGGDLFRVSLTSAQVELPRVQSIHECPTIRSPARTSGVFLTLAFLRVPLHSFAFLCVPLRPLRTARALVPRFFPITMPTWRSRATRAAVSCRRSI